MKNSNLLFVFIISIVLIATGCASTKRDSLTGQKPLSEGANINEPDRRGYNALFRAVESGQLDVVKSLISKGANIESKDSEGMTPLVYAVYYDCNADIINLLIESGADLNAKSPEGERVIDIALSATKGYIIDDLIKSGNINLWVPEASKARLFFVGTGLWDYNTVYVGNQSKRLNQNKYVGLAFIDVDPGNHTISVSEKPATPKPILSVDAIAGRTYYFHVTQDMKRRAAHYLMVKLSSVVITPLKEVEAKDKIKEILKSKELK